MSAARLRMGVDANTSSNKNTRIKVVASGARISELGSTDPGAGHFMLGSHNK